MQTQYEGRGGCCGGEIEGAGLIINIGFMYKIITTLFFAVIFLPKGFPQKNKKINRDLEVKDLTKISLTPGISYEKKVNERQTLLGKMFINFGGHDRNDHVFPDLDIDPALAIQYRYYFPFRKSTFDSEQNSGNYLAAFQKLWFSKKPYNGFESFFKRHTVNQIGIIAGKQYNGSQRFSMDCNIGIGYLFTKVMDYDINGKLFSSNYGKINGAGSLSLGFWLDRRK